MNIHPTAVIHPEARLASNVQVGPFAFVDQGVEVGADTLIGPHVVILPHTTLGAGCRVHTGAVLGDLPQDLSFKNVVSYLKIGARCVIREYVTIHRGTKEGSATLVGDDCMLMALCHLAHNVRLGNRVIIANASLLGGYVEVGERAFISGGVAIHQFVRIGRLAMIGGNTALSKDVPPFCLVPSLERNLVGGLNIVGLRRAGVPPEERRQIKLAFDRLYRSGLNVTQAVEKLREEFPAGPAAELAAFITGSRRGICGFLRTASAGEEDEATAE